MARTFAEFFRQPDIQIGYLAGGLTMGMLLSMPMIVVGIGGDDLVRRAGRHQRARRRGVTPLAEKLIAQIRADGPMTVADFMAACLADPEHGYYMRREPFGRAGDFITAPEISQMFGELVGLWAVGVWEMMGSPDAVRPRRARPRPRHADGRHPAHGQASSRRSCRRPTCI